ncbi:4-(cytidine 5'-diphospho)-2-C-methyl-D-erythritol kinase [Moraxella marmotae]|uniref:4-(cytidine 5'-diphospho)-2-C-methyl-D-erythritol kinase n=1 Tax=Moraxella marmotae TaxID=3344520 RepID=UPI0035F28FB9
MSLQHFSPAKLNLFLHITAKRADGYHNLQSVFRAIDFGDELTFTLATAQTPLVTLSGADTLTEHLDDNLIIKAVQLLAKHYPQHAKAVNIHLDKKIPTGAGLGGGSSNAATTLIALNELWHLELSPQTLMALGKTLGADVPFFIFSHANQADAHALGIGDELEPLNLPQARYLLLFPPVHLATAVFFAHPDLPKNCPLIAPIAERYGDYSEQMTAEFCNVFEPIAAQHSSAVKTALDYLRSLEPLTASTARLTGTGSTVFLPIPAHIDDGVLTAWQLSAPCPSIIAESLY